MDKECELCGQMMYNVIHNKKYCTECKPKADKLYKAAYGKKYYKEKVQPHSYQDCLDNFTYIMKKYHDPIYLTTKGFNYVSNISVISTCQVLQVSWCELLAKHGLIDKLYEYVLQEFNAYYNRTLDLNTHNLFREHPYLTQDIGKYFTLTRIKKDCGMGSKRHSKQVLINNFHTIMEQLGHPPCYSEFAKLSKISTRSYYKTFSDSWDEIVQMICDEEQFQLYMESQKQKQITTAKLGNAKKFELYGITEEELENEFRNIFDSCFKKYGVYPTRRYFGKLSKYSDMAYRKRFKIPWGKICKMYGYEIPNRHKAEGIVLEMIKEIVGQDYIHQHSWDWLIGSGGKNMFCDGYFLDLNLVVEFDGVQHKKPVVNMGGEEAYRKRVINDALKDKLLAEHNVNLIRIDSRKNWHDYNWLIKYLEHHNIPISITK